LRPGWSRVRAASALLLTGALLAVSVYFLTVRQSVQAEEHAKAEFVAAARQVVVTLMSIDDEHPQQSVQQIIDNSVDPFRAEFQLAAEDFVRLSGDAKVNTRAAVDAVAVESMTADGAVMLVSATTKVTDQNGIAEAPRSWRMTVDLQRDGDRIKMSKVEFVQ